MSWLIELCKYMIAVLGLYTIVFINIHIRDMEEKEMEENNK